MALYTTGRRSNTSSISPPRSCYDGSDYETSYNNYSEQLLDTLPSIDEYSHSDYRLAPRSSSGPNRNSGQIEAFGTRFLSAVSESVRIPPSVTATATSLSRRTSLHARARSLATYVPSLTGTTSDNPQSKRPMRRFGSLLSGNGPSSPTKEENTEETEYIMDYKPTLTSTPERSVGSPSRNRPLRSRTDSSSSNIKSLSTWFGAKKEAPATTMELEDPLLNLNVTAQLFPNGSVDPLSPSSFNDLLLNAESLIKRLQAGYKEKVDLLRSSRAEREAQGEEVEEAETRARHLKIQLDEMAAKAAEQDRAMQILVNELAAEKKARQEQQISRQVVSNGNGFFDNVSADADTTPRRPDKVAYRTSDGTASDSGFESDADTASTFSGPTTPSSPERVRLSPKDREQMWEARDIVPKNLDLHIPFRREQSSPLRHRTDAGTMSLVTSLRQENLQLQIRVKDLEGAVEGALGLVGAL